MTYTINKYYVNSEGTVARFDGVNFRRWEQHDTHAVLITDLEFLAERELEESEEPKFPNEIIL